MKKKTGNLGCFVCPLPVFFFAQLPTIFGNITNNVNKEVVLKNFLI